MPSSTCNKAVQRKRTPGVKPALDRAGAVARALRELDSIGAPYSVTDIAERAGISRATIYRDPSLRDLIGARGDVPRPVPHDKHQTLRQQHATLRDKAQDLRRRLADLEQSWEEMRGRALRAEREAREADAKCDAAERRNTSLAAQLARGIGLPSLRSLLAGTTVGMSTAELRKARRLLAAALHPDRFANDHATAAIAAELLKAVNTLAD
jgi:DNA-binding IclR family transcriptional regulator